MLASARCCGVSAVSPSAGAADKPHRMGASRAGSRGRCAGTGAGLNAESVGRRLTEAAKAAGIESRLTGHSGRVGLATELTARGASTTETMLAGGWSTARMRPTSAPQGVADQLTADVPTAPETCGFLRVNGVHGAHAGSTGPWIRGAECPYAVAAPRRSARQGSPGGGRRRATSHGKRVSGPSAHRGALAGVWGSRHHVGRWRACGASS